MVEDKERAAEKEVGVFISNHTEEFQGQNKGQLFSL